MHNMTLAMRNLNSAILVKGHSVTHFVNEQIPSKPHATSRTNGALQSSQSAANLLIITKFHSKPHATSRSNRNLWISQSAKTFLMNKFLQNHILLSELIGLHRFHRMQQIS